MSASAEATTAVRDGDDDEHVRVMTVALHERGYVVIRPEALGRLEALLIKMSGASDDRAARLEAARVHGVLQSLVSMAALDAATFEMVDGTPRRTLAHRHDWAEPSAPFPGTPG